MSDESTVQPALAMTLATSVELQCPHKTAWRSSFAAALRVMDHHRANLEARMTLQRLRREERRSIDDATGTSGRG